MLTVMEGKGLRAEGRGVSFCGLCDRTWRGGGRNFSYEPEPGLDTLNLSYLGFSIPFLS